MTGRFGADVDALDAVADITVFPPDNGTYTLILIQNSV